MKDSGKTLSNNMIYYHFMSVPNPDHLPVNGEYTCMIDQPERSKREDPETGCGALNSRDNLERDK